MNVVVQHGDSRDVIATLADASIDACVCDPPYALVSIGKRFGADDAAPAKAGKSGAYARASAGFMGQKWDTGEVAFDPDFWRQVLRVLKPGAHVLAFGGTRTYHRLAVAIEDAGFEIRDAIQWLYGSGFPKSHDVGKAIDKAAGMTRAVLAEGAPVKRMIPGADQHHAGWKKTDGRVFVPTKSEPATDDARQWEGWGTALKPACEIICVARKPLIGTVAGTVLKHGTGALNIDGCRVATDETITATRNIALGSSSGGVFGAADKPGVFVQNERGRWPANVVHDGSAEVVEAFPGAPGAQGIVTGREPSTSTRHNLGLYNEQATFMPRGGAGSAARFFYTAKADVIDRLGSKHPTVKPVDLVRWLVRLVTPPGGTVLDPFAGSGTTGMACLAEGFNAILIEREAQYVADIRRRIAHVSGHDAPLFQASAE